MSDELNSKERDRLQTILTNLCRIILTDNENISEDEISHFVHSLDGDDIELLNRVSGFLEHKRDNPFVRFTVQSCIIDYSQNFQDLELDDKRRFISPFDFDSGDSFETFIELFESEYKKKANGAAVPRVFEYVFSCIQRVSEQYRYFEQFYTIRFQQTQLIIFNETNKIVQKNAKKLVDDAIQNSVERLTIQAAESAAESAAEKAAQKAAIKASYKAVERSEQASTNAEQAAESAKKAREEASDAAKKAVEDAVEKKMTEVSTKVSETTVTVLGIFSAIVLTIVGGFIYTTSVIGNARSVNYFKLISLTSLVGLVCFDLLILMFHYIFRIRGKDTRVTKNWIVILANILLGLVMIVSGIMYFTVPDPHDPEKTNSAPAEAATEMQTEESTSFAGDLDVMHESTEQLQLTENQP